MSKNKMTTYSMEELECPKCGKKHRMKKYSLINVTEKSEMKEEILKNRIFFFHCDECHMAAPLTYGSCYLDSGHKLVIMLSPEGEMDEDMQKWEKKKGMVCRVVDNINDLKEKILIIDSHLDDRIIELVKIQYLREMEREMQNDTLLNILFDRFEEKPCFLVFFEKKGVGRIPLNMDMYEKTRNDYGEQIKSHSTDSFMKVDMEWAGDIFFKRS